jgi:hypothetical protein
VQVQVRAASDLRRLSPFGVGVNRLRAASQPFQAGVRHNWPHVIDTASE